MVYCLPPSCPKTRSLTRQATTRPVVVLPLPIYTQTGSVSQLRKLRSRLPLNLLKGVCHSYESYAAGYHWTAGRKELTWQLKGVYLTVDRSLPDSWQEFIWQLTGAYLTVDRSLSVSWQELTWQSKGVYLTVDRHLPEGRNELTWQLTGVYLTVDTGLPDG